MAEETKEMGVTIAGVLDIHRALNGVKLYNTEGQVVGEELKGINYIRIPEAKFSTSQLSKQVKDIIESYQEALKELQLEYYEFDDVKNEFVLKDDEKGKKVNVLREGKTRKALADAGEEMIKADCGVTLRKLPLAILARHPEVLSKHLEYLSPVLDGPEEIAETKKK